MTHITFHKTANDTTLAISMPLHLFNIDITKLAEKNGHKIDEVVRVGGNSLFKFINFNNCDRIDTNKINYLPEW